MKARTLVFLGVWAGILGAAVGCRAIVGIHDLELVDAAGGGGGEDAQASDATTTKDAGADAPPNNACASLPKDSCRTCCRSSFPQGFGALVRPRGGPPCYCTTCSSKCSTTACNNPPNPPQADEACNECIQREALDNVACAVARTCTSEDAGIDKQCQDFLACADKCK